MKYLKRFNEGKNNTSLVEFLCDLNDAIKPEGFLVCICNSFGDHMTAINSLDNLDKYDPDDSYIEINKNGNESDSYIDFDLGDFSIQKLKDQCNEYLDDDKLTWIVSDVVKDDYDLLCTTILTFLDEKVILNKYKKIHGF